MFHSAKCKMYENSDDNILRSVLVYCSLRVMGTTKYMNIYQGCIHVEKNCMLAMCLLLFLTTNSFYFLRAQFGREELCFDLSDELKVNGYFDLVLLFHQTLWRMYRLVIIPSQKQIGHTCVDTMCGDTFFERASPCL